MNKVNTILLDFDGTIANTLNSVIKIYNSIAPTLKCKTVNEEDIEMLRGCRPQEFMRKYKVSLYKVPYLVLKGREELQKQMHLVQPIEHMVEVIGQLFQRGYKLGILTSNSRNNIQMFLKKHGLEGAFDFIYTGRNIFGKSKIIHQIFKEQKLSKDNVLLIGDETRDIEAANKLRIPIVAVSWGYNKQEALIKLAPTYLVHHPIDILNVVNQIVV